MVPTVDQNEVCVSKHTAAEGDGGLVGLFKGRRKSILLLKMVTTTKVSRTYASLSRRCCSYCILPYAVIDH